MFARRTGRTIKAVVAERVARRIRLPAGLRRWTANETKLLGKFSDAELARRLGRTLGQARIQRLAHKIPPLKPRPKFRYWTPGEIRLLGTMPDADLARKLERTLSSVQSQRILLGAAYLKPRFRPWTREEEQLLGKHTDQEVARILGRGLSGVKTRRISLGISLPTPQAPPWTKAELKQLGTDKDEVVAHRLGRSLIAVRTRRSVLGILKFDLKGPGPGPGRRKLSWELPPTRKLPADLIGAAMPSDFTGNASPYLMRIPRPSNGKPGKKSC